MWAEGTNFSHELSLAPRAGGAPGAGTRAGKGHSPGLEAEGSSHSSPGFRVPAVTGWSGVGKSLTSHEPENTNGTNERLSFFNKELKLLQK